MALSPILSIPLLASNQTGKETTINDAINYLEKAQNDAVTVDFAAGNVTLPLVDLQRYFYFKAANVSGARDFTVPASKRIFAFDNTSGANAVTIKMGSESLVCNTGEVYVVANTGSVLKFLYNSEGAGGTIAFPSLSDTPNSYSGQALYVVRVNATEDGLEFVDPSGGTIAFTDLSDVPSDYTGDALKLLRVNTGATAVEFVTVANVIHISTLDEEDGTTRTLALTDLGKIIRTTNVSPVQITVPLNSSVAFAVGSTIHVRQAGDGQVEIVAAVGVTINTPSTLLMSGKHGTLTLIKVATNEWDILGALQPL